MSNDTARQPIWWTKQEFARVRALASGSTRDSLMILLATTYALRRSELLSLTLANLSDGKISCNRGKGSKPVYESLVPEISALLAQYVAEEKITDAAQPLFRICSDQFYRIVRNYALKAGLKSEKARAHALRHSGIAWFYRACRDIYRTQIYAGHVAISNTVKYANLSPEEAAAANESVLGNLLAA